MTLSPEFGLHSFLFVFDIPVIRYISPLRTRTYPRNPHNQYFYVLFLQQESGGTVLSTNWKEIGGKKVEVKPPDGMEYKTWEY